MSVSLGQGPCLSNCCFTRIRRGRSVSLGLLGAPRVPHFSAAWTILLTHFFAKTFAQVGHMCQQHSPQESQLPSGVACRSDQTLNRESPQLNCWFFQRREYCPRTGSSFFPPLGIVQLGIPEAETSSQIPYLGKHCRVF